jgi:hypothetical protein
LDVLDRVNHGGRADLPADGRCSFNRSRLEVLPDLLTLLLARINALS